MGMLIKEGKNTGPRVRQPWYPEVARNRADRAYVNRFAGGVWTHVGLDGESHPGDWQKCETCK